MVVYSRTEKGQIAAYGGDSALPRKLKSLLRVIDGKTEIDIYVRNLHAFGDVKEILTSLEMAGLLSSNNSQTAISQPSNKPDIYSAAQQPRSGRHASLEAGYWRDG